MRLLILAVGALAIMSVPICQASIVIHGGTPGIVAENDWQFLDSFGHVWRIEANGVLHRQTEWDPPLPPDSLKFWTAVRFVTNRNEFYWYDEGQQIWVSLGFWSAVSGAHEEDSPSAPGVFPNPSPGIFRVSFHVPLNGPTTVELVDVTGRVVRRLHDGPHPAGDYSLVWNSRDDDGGELPSGTYFTRIETADGVTTARVVLTR